MTCSCLSAYRRVHVASTPLPTVRLTASPSLSSHQAPGLHLVRGDDVRFHHRAAGVAGDRDDLLLQEDLGGGRGSSERERGGVFSDSLGE